MPRIPEREFIRGNRDGPNRRNETYTVCRVNVPMKRFEKERALGLHPVYLERRVSPGWRCPAQARRRATAPASLAAYEDKQPTLAGPAQEVEIVHKTLRQSPAGRPTCVICRLGVARERLVEEIETYDDPKIPNLHPGFSTFTADGETFVRGRQGVDADNVNYPSACDYCAVGRA